MTIENFSRPASETEDAELFRTCMEKAARQPEKLIRETGKTNDAPYWQIFWTYFAGLKLNDDKLIEKLSNLIDDDEDIEGGDIHFLLAYGEYLEACEDTDDDTCKDWALSYLDLAKEAMSPLLTEASDALHQLLVRKAKDPLPENFYTQELLAQ